MLEHHPTTPIDIVITDETDDANGFAETTPQNVITIFAGVPPTFSTLGDYDDFLQLLVLHELVHIVHIDTIIGIPKWVNNILGKTMVPNSVQPSWIVEGIAVFMESRLTNGGRVKSSYIDALIRAQILSGGFPDLDRLSHFTRTYPGSSYSWFLGGRFIDFIARRHGTDAIAAMSRMYGARPIPYAINLVAERVTGETFVDLYAAWRAEETARANAIVERVSRDGLVVGDALERSSPLAIFPRFSPTGELALIEQPRDGDDDLVILEADLVTERLRLRTVEGPGGFTPDGLFYVSSIRDTVDRAYSHRDLEVIEVATGQRRRRTIGYRLSEPDVSPDGQKIVAVAQEAGRTRLVTLPLDGDLVPTTFDVLAPGEQVYEPRWSNDGRWIAASVKMGTHGAHQIVLFDADGERRVLTTNDARKTAPCWSVDGRRIFYASDRGGVFNIHAVDVQTKEVVRLTNVVTAAMQPAAHPDGDRLVYVHATAKGWELRMLPLDSTRLPLEPPVTRTIVTATVSTAVYPEEPYSPWASLIPKAWLPSIGLDGVGDTYGIILSGRDVLKNHLWSLDLRYGVASERLGFDFSYTNRQTPWPLSVSAGLTHTTRPGLFAASVEADDRLETIFRARASISFPLGQWDTGHALSFSYGAETRRGLTLFDPDPQGLSPRGQGDLTLASLTASWSFSNTRGYAESISTEQGHALAVSFRVHAPQLGSDLRVFDVTAAWNYFVRMPWLQHHVIATRVSMGGASGDPNGRAVYVLGGLPVRNVVMDAVEGVGFGLDIIRGYERSAFRGTAFYLGTVEYRFPLTSITAGWATLPFYLDRLSAAAFVDAGYAIRNAIELDQTKVGVGAELRLDLAVGYFQPYTLRFGAARGLAEEGIDNVYLVLGGLF